MNIETMTKTSQEDREYLHWLTTPVNEGGGGYYRARPLGDGLFLAITRLLFHWSLHVCEGGNYMTYVDRWCYQTQEMAEAALDADWDGTGDAPLGWHRHPYTGRRRPNGDPTQEYREA
jgi:hypothetical protein